MAGNHRAGGQPGLVPACGPVRRAVPGASGDRARAVPAARPAPARGRRQAGRKRCRACAIVRFAECLTKRQATRQNGLTAVCSGGEFYREQRSSSSGATPDLCVASLHKSSWATKPVAQATGRVCCWDGGDTLAGVRRRQDRPAVLDLRSVPDDRPGDAERRAAGARAGQCRSRLPVPARAGRARPRRPQRALRRARPQHAGRRAARACGRLLHLLEPQGGAAVLREARRPALVSLALRGIRKQRERHLYRCCAQPAHRAAGRPPARPVRAQRLSGRLELHLGVGEQQGHARGGAGRRRPGGRRALPAGRRDRRLGDRRPGARLPPELRLQHPDRRQRLRLLPPGPPGGPRPRSRPAERPADRELLARRARAGRDRRRRRRRPHQLLGLLREHRRRHQRGLREGVPRALPGQRADQRRRRVVLHRGQAARPRAAPRR